MVYSHSRGEDETFPTHPSYSQYSQQPANVSSAYTNSGPDPFGLLKQAGQCLNQQHYLDPKYHGQGHGLATMINNQTGDKELTKRIITIGGLALVIGGIFFITLMPHHGDNTSTNMAAMKSDPDFDPKLSDIAKLFKHPERNYQAFDEEYGPGAAVRVITAANPRFKREHVAELLKNPPSAASEFDAEYGNGAADKLLSGHLGRDKERQERVKRALAAEQERSKAIKSGQSKESYDGERDQALDTIEGTVAKEKLKSIHEEQAQLSEEEAMTIQEEKTAVAAEREEGKLKAPGEPMEEKKLETEPRQDGR